MEKREGDLPIGLTKYPVVSPSGVKYRVKTDEVSWSLWTWDVVRVYQERQGWLFKRWACVYELQQRRGIKDSLPLVQFVENAVRSYEAKCMTLLTEEKVAEENERKFHEWDGVIR